MCPENADKVVRVEKCTSNVQRIELRSAKFNWKHCFQCKNTLEGGSKIIKAYMQVSVLHNASGLYRSRFAPSTITRHHRRCIGHRWHKSNLLEVALSLGDLYVRVDTYVCHCVCAPWVTASKKCYGRYQYLVVNTWTVGVYFTMFNFWSSVEVGWESILSVY